jgi:hypothetical protein
LTSRCPAMTWAMCGGSPARIASVMTIRRKSWGVKISGWPAASVSPARASAALSMLRTVAVETCRVSVPARRWKQQRGRGLPDVLVVVVAGGERDLPFWLLQPGDDRGQHVGEFGRDD